MLNYFALLIITILFLLSPSIAHAEMTKKYYPNYTLKSEVNIIDNKKVGTEKQYYRSGALKAELNYLSGKLEGFSRIYFENGDLKIEAEFLNDEVVSHKYYVDGSESQFWLK